MERLSNDIKVVYHEAEIEIECFNLKQGEKIIAYFSEIPPIKGFPYKIIIVEKPDGNIYSGFRQWDTDYNFSQWTNGIYNPDRLRIITDEKKLSETDTALFQEQLLQLEQLELPENLQNEKALVLDPSVWKFGIRFANKEVNYTWKTPTDDLNLFVPIIELLRKQHLNEIV